jgi:hypothetical protein
LANSDISLVATGNAFFQGPNVQIQPLPSGGQGNLTITNGKAFKPGGGTWESYSDQRVKKDIVDFNMGLAEIDRLNPVRFKYNGLGGTVEDGKEYVGVVAQELEEVAPFMVSSKQEKLRTGDKVPSAIKQVDSSALTYMLVNAVQELSRRDKELTQRNRELTELVCQDHPNATVCRGISKGLARK